MTEADARTLARLLLDLVGADHDGYVALYQETFRISDDQRPCLRWHFTVDVSTTLSGLEASTLKTYAPHLQD